MATEPRKSCRVLIEGRVQGVGFRAFVETRATGLGLTGWVRNRRDGAVEASLHGASDKIETMLDVCRRGPPAARVDMLREMGEPEPAPSTFTMRPTV